MGIRIAHEPVAAPIIASYATGVGQAQERQKQKSLDLLKYQDQNMRETQKFWMNRQWDVQDQQNRFQHQKDMQQGQIQAWEGRDARRDARRHWGDMIGNLPEIPEHTPPMMRKPLQGLMDGIRKIQMSPDYDPSDPETAAALADAIEDYRATIRSIGQPDPTKNLNANRAYRGPDNMYHPLKPGEPIPEGSTIGIIRGDDFIEDPPPEPDPAAIAEAEAAKKAAEEAEANKQKKMDAINKRADELMKEKDYDMDVALKQAEEEWRLREQFWNPPEEEQPAAPEPNAGGGTPIQGVPVPGVGIPSAPLPGLGGTSATSLNDFPEKEGYSRSAVIKYGEDGEIISRDVEYIPNEATAGAPTPAPEQQQERAAAEKALQDYRNAKTPAEKEKAKKKLPQVVQDRLNDFENNVVPYIPSL